MRFRRNTYTIVIEGPDMVGKTTLATRLFHKLEYDTRGIITVGLYKEPHRSGLKTAVEFLQDRMETVRMVNRDAGESQFHVAIIDRYNPSTRIYNRDTFKRNIEARLLEAKVPVPDRIIILNHKPFTAEWKIWLDHASSRERIDRRFLASVSIAYEHYWMHIRGKCSARTLLYRPTDPEVEGKVYDIIVDDVTRKIGELLGVW